MASSSVSPWEVPEFKDRVQELQHRLAFADIAAEIPDCSWNYGVPRDVMLQWVKFWKVEYDWPAERAKINAFPHFMMRLSEPNGGTDLHFIHQRSSRPGAIPIILIHGWPGSFVEFLDTIDALANPADPNQQAFHVVVPSLPGYGFSHTPKRKGYGPMAMAKAFAELMSALGYEQFASQGGDWGGFVTRCLAVQFPHRCRAIHLNMISAPPPTFWQDPVANLALRGFLSQSWALTPSEIKFQAQAPRFNASEMGYHMLQRTKPQTIAYALQDSPTGLLAWILEKFQTWTDKGLPPPTASLRDHPFAVKVMTNIHIYYLTRSAGSAARLYKEAQRTRDLAKVFFTKVTVPTGVSMFEHEIGQAPKRWCLNWYDLRFWVEHPVGGHFAALEEPEVLVGDLRHFFGREDIRKAIFGPGEKIKGKI